MESLFTIECLAKSKVLANMVNSDNDLQQKQSLANIKKPIRLMINFAIMNSLLLWKIH